MRTILTLMLLLPIYVFPQEKINTSDYIYIELRGTVYMSTYKKPKNKDRDVFKIFNRERIVSNTKLYIRPLFINSISWEDTTAITDANGQFKIIFKIKNRKWLLDSLELEFGFNESFFCNTFVSVMINNPQEFYTKDLHFKCYRGPLYQVHKDDPSRLIRRKKTIAPETDHRYPDSLHY